MLNYEPTVTFLFVATLHFLNLLMFNATGGYSTDPYEVQRSVACMYRSHSEIKQGYCNTQSVYFHTTIPETAISI